MNLDSRARDAAAAVRASVAGVADTPLRPPPRRPELRRSLVAVMTLTMVAAAVALAVGRTDVTSVSMRPPDDRPAPNAGPPRTPPPLPDFGPAGPATPLVTGTARDGREWAVYIGGPSNDLCLGVDSGDPHMASGMCAGGSFGPPPQNPNRPLVFNDLRLPWFVFGRVPADVTAVTVVFGDGSTSSGHPVIQATGHHFYVVEVRTGTAPSAVVGFRSDGSSIRLEI